MNYSFKALGKASKHQSRLPSLDIAMHQLCTYSVLRSNGESQYPCYNSAVCVDRMGRMFCAKHTYAALRPFSLLVDDKDFDLSVGVGIVQNLNETPSERECVAFAQNIAPIAKSIIDLADVDERLFYSVGPNYVSIGEMIEAHSVYLPKARQKGCEDWRLLPYPVAGEVNGLPMFRGLAVATNGVHVAIETSNGALIFGHVGWFVVDKEEPVRDMRVLFAPVAEFRISSTVKQQLNELESLFSL